MEISTAWSALPALPPSVRHLLPIMPCSPLAFSGLSTLSPPLHLFLFLLLTAHFFLCLIPFDLVPRAFLLSPSPSSSLSLSFRFPPSRLLLCCPSTAAGKHCWQFTKRRLWVLLLHVTPGMCAVHASEPPSQLASGNR